MQPIRVAAFALVAAGVLALAYGGLTYTRATHEAKVGPLEISVQDNRTVNIPAWAGIGAIVLGGALLLAGRKSS